MAATESSSLRVCVVGAGVIGLSTATHLLERFPGKLDLTVMADSFSPSTTSDKASGVFLYSDLGLAPSQVVPTTAKWFSSTMKRMSFIISSSENAKVGVSLSHGYIFWDNPQPDPWWKDIVFGFRRVELDSAEAKALTIPPTCEEIFAFTTYILHPTCYLKWMLDKINSCRCKVVKKKISSLEELSSTYDVVINCTGLSSCKELAKDSSLYPVQGQGLLVKAPWVKHWLLHVKTNAISYVIPRSLDVMLGGTAEVGNWCEDTDQAVLSGILGKCKELVPSLSGAESAGSFVGLRPGRDGVRLERCEVAGGCVLIHCYGHGGKGLVLSWGCALDIGHMIQEILDVKNPSN